MNQKIVCVALALFLVSPVARAANITLVTDASIGAPLTMLPGATSDEMLLSVQNDTFPNSEGDFLSGYQVVLQIVPQATASGTLTFATPFTGSGLAEPTNYVFSAVDHFGLDADNSGTELFLFDLVLLTSGVDIPTSPGNSIALITFLASADAQGLFEIVAIPGVANSGWTNDFFSGQQFANVPFMGGPVVIGQVWVVPEPSCLTAGSLCLLGCLQLRRRRSDPCCEINAGI